MPQQVHLCLRIGAVVSSLLLLTGLVAYRTGLLFPQGVVTQDYDVTQDHPNESSNFNSIGTEDSQRITNVGQTEPEEVDQPRLPGVNLNGVSTNTGVMEYDKLNVNGDVMGTASTRVTQELLDEIQRDPAQSQIRRDVLTLMSGSKSPGIVVFPSTPVEMQTAVEKFKSGAAKYFVQKDRNGDGKLTKDELHDNVWRKLLEKRAVENDSVDSEGFLKIYVWLCQQK